MGDKGGKKDKEKGQKQNVENRNKSQETSLISSQKESLDRDNYSEICITVSSG